MKKKVLKITIGAMLAALAIAICFFENRIPQLPFLPPGAKPGFSNIIVMFALCIMGNGYAAMIVPVKALFAFVTRGATAALMSLFGGAFAFAAMSLAIKLSKKNMGFIGISVPGALFHNIGQLIAAVLLTGTTGILYYLPALAVFAAISGAVNGVVAGAVINSLKKIKLFDTLKENKEDFNEDTDRCSDCR